MSEFKDRLKEARLEAKLSQEQLANLLGIAQSTIAAYETGERKTSRRITQIAGALGVETLWLATGRGPKRAADTVDSPGHGIRPDILSLARKLALVPDEKLRAVALLLDIEL